MSIRSSCHAVTDWDACGLFTYFCFLVNAASCTGGRRAWLLYSRGRNIQDIPIRMWRAHWSASAPRLHPEPRPEEPPLPDSLAAPLKELLGRPLLFSRYRHLFLPHLRGPAEGTGHHQQDLSISVAMQHLPQAAQDWGEQQGSTRSTRSPGREGALPAGSPLKCDPEETRNASCQRRKRRC